MRAALLTAALLLAGTAAAHDGVKHKSVAEARAHANASAAVSAGPDTAFPLAVGGDYTLTDQTGEVRTQVDPDGQLQMVFFGYANCQAICSVALPLMAEIAQTVQAEGIPVTPVMITVDPDRDTVQTIGAPLALHHPDFVGLTGTPEELAPVYDLFSVEHKLVFEDPEYGPIYAHGSHIYLMDAEGAFLTLLPPILSAERAAEIVVSYAATN